VSFISQKALEIQKTKSSTNQVAWMVSNCGTHSERENFVEQLQHFIPVDVYGACGHFEVGGDLTLTFRFLMSNAFAHFSNLWESTFFLELIQGEVW
jgi:hypothetical protein